MSGSNFTRSRYGATRSGSFIYPMHIAFSLAIHFYFRGVDAFHWTLLGRCCTHVTHFDLARLYRIVSRLYRIVSNFVYGASLKRDIKLNYNRRDEGKVSWLYVLGRPAELTQRAAGNLRPHSQEFTPGKLTVILPRHTHAHTRALCNKSAMGRGGDGGRGEWGTVGSNTRRPQK